MTALLRISGQALYVLSVGRNAAVEDVLWTRVLAEWGTVGTDPNLSIDVPIEAFLANLDWLAPICRRFETGIEWDDAARNLVVKALSERNALSEMLSTFSPLSAQQVQARLQGGRFIRSLRAFQLRDLGKLLALTHGANFSMARQSG